MNKKIMNKRKNKMKRASKRINSNSMGPLPNWDCAAKGKVPDYYSLVLLFFKWINQNIRFFSLKEFAENVQQTVLGINKFPLLPQHQPILNDYVQQSWSFKASSSLYPTFMNNYSEPQFKLVNYSKTVSSNVSDTIKDILEFVFYG